MYKNRLCLSGSVPSMENGCKDEGKRGPSDACCSTDKAYDQIRVGSGSLDMPEDRKAMLHSRCTYPCEAQMMHV